MITVNTIKVRIYDNRVQVNSPETGDYIDCSLELIEKILKFIHPKTEIIDYDEDYVDDSQYVQYEEL